MGIIKEVKREHYCALPGFVSKEMMGNGPGTQWQCDECKKIYTYVKNFWGNLYWKDQSGKLHSPYAFQE